MWLQKRKAYRYKWNEFRGGAALLKEVTTGWSCVVMLSRTYAINPSFFTFIRYAYSAMLFDTAGLIAMFKCKYEEATC